MDKIYRFKAQLKSRKGHWRTIEIKGSQTLGDFDGILRDAFNRDFFDHLSEFYRGRVWESEGFGEIYPFGEGPGNEVIVGDLGLQPGDTLEYVYDFGDDIQHVLALENIVEPEAGANYPRVVAKSQPKSRSKKPSE